MPLSRRGFLHTTAQSSAALLFSARLAPADLLAKPLPTGQSESPSAGAPGSNLAPPVATPLTGPAAKELRLFAVTPNTLRLTLAAAGEDLDRLYHDGSLTPRAMPRSALAPPTLTSPLNDTTPTHEAAPAPEAHPREIPWGRYTVRISTAPLRVEVHETVGSTDPIQQLTFDPEGNRVRFGYRDSPVYGLGPGSHPLDQRGNHDRMRNGAGDDLRVLGARNPIPWLLGRGWALFLHQPFGTFDLSGAEGVFHPADSPRPLSLFLSVAPTPADLLREYAEITGYPHLPARWTLGFQQSHRTLDSPEQLLDEAQTFRDKKLPADTLIYLGTGFCPSGWNTGHGSFAFNQAVFPDPAAQVRALHDRHFKVVLHVVNPPEDLHGTVADTPPAASIPGDAASYWQEHTPLLPLGVDGWWPDEGDILPGPARLVRNRLYWEGGRLSRPDRRPFALHRNCTAGIQRWGWLWSGDVFSTWKTLETQIMMGINAGLNGVPFWGTDIGGFVPTAEFTAELFVRWFQFGSVCPSFRCHGRTWQLRRSWGWNTGSFGPSEMGPDADRFLPRPDDLHNAAVEPICRRYLELRYQLLPYLYSACRETHTTGLPLIRSLGLSYPDDPRAWANVNAYLWGPSILAAPVFERGATARTVYLPSGNWYDLWTGKPHSGGREITVPADLATMPLFVRAGAILPTGPTLQYTAEPTIEPVTLTVYPGADGEFRLYTDDGETFRYEQGDYTLIHCQWRDADHTLTLTPEHTPAQASRLSLRVTLRDGTPQVVTLARKPLTLRL